MGSGMPEIGSRISLISKADIRYEGKLFSIDPEECTIALSSVRSFGTETRETNFPVPAQSQVYDYILFRGTDIKDIVVQTATIPNDPAIVQLSVPPSLSDSQFVKSHISGYPQPPLVPMSMPSAPSTSKDHPQTFQNSFAGASSKGNVTESTLKPQSVQNVVSEDESGSSSQTQKVKNADGSGRVNAGPAKDEQNHISLSMRRPPTFNRDKPTGNSNNTNNNNRYQLQQQAPRQQQQHQQQRYQPQNRYPQQQQHQRYMPQQQQQQYRDYNRDNQYRNYNDYRDSYGPRQYAQPLRNNQRTENWNSYGQRRNNRLGQNGQPQNSYQSAGYQNQNRKPKNTLKFEDDYDFEQANTEFEQMRTQLEKIKLEESAKMNGEVDSKKEESVEESVVSNEVVPEENEGDEDKPIFYDKVRSFFDQISYEAIERSKGVTARVDWKTERKINSETFGQMALRRNSNFHGRAGGNQGYYNYQNRNSGTTNSYRNNNNNNNRFSRQQNNQPRKQYSTVVKNHESGKENRSS